MNESNFSEILIDENMNFSIQSNTYVTCKDRLTLRTEGGKVFELEVDIKSNFKDIPSEYQHIFVSMMTAKYCSIVTTSSSKESPFVYQKKKNKWYQFWK